MAQQESTTAPPQEVQRLIPKQPECNIGTAGHVDSGKCIDPSQYVLLDDVPMTGWQVIQKAKTEGILLSQVNGEEVYQLVNNKVVSLNKALEPVNAASLLFVQHYKGPLFSIRGKSGRELRMTPEHPLLINRKGVIQWIKAKDIGVGDHATFVSTVPLSEQVTLPDAIQDLQKFYHIVSWTDYQSIKSASSDFADYTAMDVDLFEKTRILLGLNKTRLFRLARINSKTYDRIVRHEKTARIGQRDRIVNAFKGCSPIALGPNQFLVEQRRGNRRPVRKLVRLALDDDIVKWFAFVWSEGTSSPHRVGITQTIQRGMLSEFLRISAEKMCQKINAHSEGQFTIHNKAFVDYLRFRFSFVPGNESVCGIADWVCKLPRSQKALFLRWFLTLDGEFNDHGQICVTQLNDRNIAIIGYLLQSFGIIPKFGTKWSPTQKGRKAYSRIILSGRKDLRLYADNIGFEDSRIQNRLLSYLNRIKLESKETDRSIPINVNALQVLFRESGIMREAFRRSPAQNVMKESAWFKAYEDAIRKGRLSRTKLLLVIRAIEDQMRAVELSQSQMGTDGVKLRAHAALIGVSLHELAGEFGRSRKWLTRVFRAGSRKEILDVARRLRGETLGILHYCNQALEQLRKLANPSLEFDRIIDVRTDEYDGLVFDMTVPEHANFLAGKGAIVCHNTSIVQAITGVWASAHSEELKRGITIKVGYADAAFYKCHETPPPEAYSTSPVCPVCGKATSFLRAVSFVDAPGHESLMTNMLAGAALMDGVILVITANEPVPMPQTREHLLALQMLGMKKMVVVQNKIDRVDADGARKNYEAIKQFLANTVGADAPVIPVSAQNRINIDALIESLEETIPTPHHDLNASPQMYILRSFDVNRPGADVKSLVGGVLGGSLVRGELSVGDEIEISPGIAEERSGKYTPIATKVASLGTGAGMTQKVGPGGLIALGTALDPRLTKGDVLVGNIVGKPGSLPAIMTHITVDLQLFDQAVGSSALIKVDKVRATETLRLNIGTASTLGTVTSARDAVAELDLKKPVVAEAGGRVAISRKIAERWRLIGSGVVR
ncbi:MAG TPA: translation initiation factor IF-2 subunit gamma [Nitrososphaerales archaeon]|nr:translation initiation factor IF-2 subunit gamma [Nitrososphaerales archaeon]